MLFEVVFAQFLLRAHHERTQTAKDFALVDAVVVSLFPRMRKTKDGPLVSCYEL